jgi:hypothetical protein
MEYGRTIREAWVLTWRHRFLWILGLLAGGAVGASSGGRDNAQWRTSRPELESTLPGAAATADAVARWLEANAGLIGIAAALVVLAGLVLLTLFLIAQGGMARATADLARGHPTSLGAAWRAGLHLVWRFAGLWATVIVAAVLMAAVIGGVMALAIGAGLLVGTGAPRPEMIVPAVLVGVVMAVGALVVVLAGAIIVAYAQRAIAVEDIGAWSALRAGFDLLRVRLVPSLLAWLINLGLAIGAAIAIGIAITLVAVPVAGVVALAWISGGVGAPTIALLVVAVVAVLLALLVLIAIANTFFWHYWTLTYLRLGGHGEEVAPLLNGPDLAPLRPGAAQT